MTDKEVGKKKIIYYKTITLSLNKTDMELIESAIIQISLEFKRTVPLSHFLRFLIQNYSEDAKYKLIKENIKKS